MRSNDRYVVDASVVLKWVLQDEANVGEALAVLQGYQEGQLELLAPALIRYEVANALLVAQKQSRLDSTRVKELLDGLITLGFIRTTDSNELVQAAFSLGHTHNVTVYDALYLALASESTYDLLTADRELYNKIKTQFPRTFWIGDLRISAL